MHLLTLHEFERNSLCAIRVLQENIEFRDTCTINDIYSLQEIIIFSKVLLIRELYVSRALYETKP